MSSDSPKTLADEIIGVVKQANGIKDRDLPYAMRKHLNLHVTDQEVFETVEKLIQDKQLIAIEYSFDYTMVRNFLLPAKTPFILRGQPREEPKRV